MIGNWPSIEELSVLSKDKLLLLVVASGAAIVSVYIFVRIVSRWTQSGNNDSDTEDNRGDDSLSL